MPKVIRPVGSQAVYSTTPESTRCFGLVKSKVGKEEVTSLEVLERIMIQKVTSAHTRGNNPFKNKSGPIRLPKPTRASELWAEVPTVILCLRRPGYVDSGPYICSVPSRYFICKRITAESCCRQWERSDHDHMCAKIVSMRHPFFRALDTLK